MDFLPLLRLPHFVYYLSVHLTGFPIHHAIRLYFLIEYQSYIIVCSNLVQSEVYSIASYVNSIKQVVRKTA